MPPITLDGSLGITTPTYGGADTSEYLVPVTGFKNKIINGNMSIDQRNAGASYSTSTLASANLYTLDRWFFAGSQNSKFTVQQSSDAPSGFSNSMLITSSSAYSVTGADFFILQQAIEGFNTADLNFGTANAKTVTLSFWVKSSLTGNFGAALQNNGYGRSYPFSYTINSANTWEQKSVTVVGDTTGTWVGATNGVGLRATFSIGCAGNTGGGNAWVGANYFQPSGSTSVVGTNGATFYITGVQLEVGSTATSFDYRPYGTELALCQRYLPVWYGGGDQIITMYNSDTGILGTFKTPVPVRSTITGLTFSTNANSIFAAYDGFKGGYTPTNAALNNGGINYITIQCNSTSLGTGRAGLLRVADSQWMYGTGCEL